MAQEIPDGYYDGTDGLTGEALKKKLHQIIRGHKVRTYSEFRYTIIPDLDEDPENSDNIILFYKGTSIPKDNFATSSQADYWNREHTWPKSHGFADESDTAYTDVYNLRPADYTVNISKSNKDFNAVAHTTANEEGEAEDTYTTTDFFEPRDEIKGDVARILFYMATRYSSNALNLTLEDRSTDSGDPELGVLYTLLKWSAVDPVSDTELARQEGAYGYQGNRNPFVDHPEFAAAIWGDATGPILLLNDYGFGSDFGNVLYEDTLTQDLVVDAYNLEAEVTVTVNAPFYVSSDGENFSNEVTFTHEDGETEENFTLYVMFVPEADNGESYQDTVYLISTNASTSKLPVSGTEGEATVMTIANARSKDIGTVVSVTGVVIDEGNNNTKNRIIFDGTAGIVIRSDDDTQTSDLVRGDSVVVSGGLVDYYDWLEINETPITVQLIAQGATLPEAQEVTISEVGESYESELVVIRNVTFSDAGDDFAYGNWNVSDGTGTLILRIGSDSHPLVGSTIPSGKCDITGFIAEYNSDYEIFLRDEDDLVASSDEETDPETYELITIAEAREKADGTSVKVQGIVIGGETNSDVSRVIYDGTGGLVVRGTESGNLSSSLVTGDSVIVSGGILDYSGLMEIEESPVTIELLNSGNTLPDPQEIIISEIGEDYESELIVLRSVSISETGSFAAGSYTLSDETGSITLRITSTGHPLIGTDIPTEAFDLVAYVGENSSGYYVLTRTADDLTLLESTTLGIVAKEQLGLIYPNPATDQVTIQLPEDIRSAYTVSVYSMRGSLVKSVANRSSLSVSGIQPGVYLLVVSASQGSYYSRLIVK